jgi:hypothetical protein
MSLGDLAAALLVRPLSRVFEGPMRSVMSEVLAERGYASPAELRALHEAMQAQKAAAAAAAAQAAATEASLGALRASLDGLLAELRGEVERRQAAEARLAAAGPAAEACAAPGCADPVVAMGFCAGHHADWLAGRLAGFVGPEGLVEAGGRVHALGAAAAGLPLRVEDDGGLRVGGRRLPVC